MEQLPIHLAHQLGHSTWQEWTIQQIQLEELVWVRKEEQLRVIIWFLTTFHQPWDRDTSMGPKLLNLPTVMWIYPRSSLIITIHSKWSKRSRIETRGILKQDCWMEPIHLLLMASREFELRDLHPEQNQARRCLSHNSKIGNLTGSRGMLMFKEARVLEDMVLKSNKRCLWLTRLRIWIAKSMSKINRTKVCTTRQPSQVCYQFTTLVSPQLLKVSLSST